MLADEIDEEDEFTELYDANIPRVDLVGKGANGVPCLIAKSAEFMPPAEVRRLIAKSERGAHMPPKTFNYRHRGFRITSARRLTVGDLQAAVRRELVAKSSTSQVAVYTADGTLVGSVDPE